MKKILILEGNDDNGINKIKANLGYAYSAFFGKLLQSLKPCEVNFVKPSTISYINSTPLDESEIKKYDGILVTGSSLHIYADKEKVAPQIDILDKAFSVGVPIFGSCWGLQLGCVSAGGDVQSNTKGWEIGISYEINLTECGKKHLMYKNIHLNSFDKTNKQKKVFYRYCVHKDHIVRLPKDSLLLASNDFSVVQAAQIKYKNGIFWGTQYHPEFNNEIITSTCNRVKDLVFSDEEDYQNFVRKLTKDQITYANSLETSLAEIKNWLDFI